MKEDILKIFIKYMVDNDMEINNNSIKLMINSLGNIDDITTNELYYHYDMCMDNEEMVFDIKQIKNEVETIKKIVQSPIIQKAHPVNHYYPPPSYCHTNSYNPHNYGHGSMNMGMGNHMGPMNHTLHTNHTYNHYNPANPESISFSHIYSPTNESYTIDDFDKTWYPKSQSTFDWDTHNKLDTMAKEYIEECDSYLMKHLGQSTTKTQDLKKKILGWTKSKTDLGVEVDKEVIADDVQKGFSIKI